MRILFSSTSGAGHLQPMLPLALAAQELGHDVRWATPEDGIAHVAASGIDTVAVGLPTPVRHALFYERWPEVSELSGDALGAFMFPRTFGSAAVYAFEDLLSAAREWGPHVIVHEAGEFAAPAVAAALGIPNVTHGFGRITPAERTAEAAQFAEENWEKIGLEPRPYGGCYDHLYIDIYPPSLNDADMAHVPRRIHRRPASLDSRPGDRLPPDVDALIASPHPVAYLTFGTVFNTNAAFTNAIEALGALDVSVVATVGPKGDPDAFGPQPSNVHVARYIPQSLLLPRATFVASHAGSGTFLAALSKGLPQLCLPQAADQFRNAAACDRAGAGIQLLGNPPTVIDIRRAASQLLADDTYAAAADAIAVEVAAMPSAEEVVAELEKLAQN